MRWVRWGWPAVLGALFVAGGSPAGEPAAVKRDEGAIRRRMATYAPVRLQADLSGLGARDRLALEKIVAAVAAMDEIYWRQMGRAALAARQAFAASTDPVDRLYADFVRINYGPFDLRDGDARFVEAGGGDPRPPGAGFYPEDMTREEFEERLQAHPELRGEFERPDTVIRRVDGRLVAIPYATLFIDELKPASQALSEAAAQTDNATLRRYLSLRANALLSGDAYASDLAWIDLKDHAIDAVIGPIETYDDRLLGLKASYEGAALVRDDRASRSLEVYRKHLPSLAAALPVEERFRRFTPGAVLEVMNVVRFAGDFNAGIKTVAASLPNDERVLQKKGAKKQIYKNVLEAKFESILRPIARLFLSKRDQGKVTREAFVTNVLLHELAHTLGTATVLGSPDQTVRRALKDRHAAIEEAKADVVGIFGLRHLIEAEIFTDEEAEESYATYLAGMFRSVRFGAADAHGLANAVQLNWMLREGAVEHDAKKGEFALHARKFEPAAGRLAKELLEIEATGDYERAGRLLEDFGALDPGIRAALARTEGVPVDVVFTYPM
ncbi:MAG: dipeptidyl-peptidase 3 family protein [Candidatus Polarisedimenticolia bacterium]